jgi:hypothetical protein
MSTPNPYGNVVAGTATVGVNATVNFTFTSFPTTSTQFFNIQGIVSNYSDFFTGVPLSAASPVYGSSTGVFTNSLWTLPIPNIPGKTMVLAVEDCYGTNGKDVTANNSGATCVPSFAAPGTINPSSSRYSSVTVAPAGGKRFHKLL